DAGVDHLPWPGAGSCLRTDRHHLQRHVRRLARVQLHGGDGGDARRCAGRLVHQSHGHAGDRRLCADARLRCRDRHRHGDLDRTAGAEEPGPASLRAVHTRLRPDDPAAHRHRVEHGAAAVPAAAADRPGHFRPAVLAADAGLRAGHLRAGMALSADPDRARLPCHRRGQLCRPRPRPARAAAAHGELRAGRRDRDAGGVLLGRDDAGLLRQRAALELLRLRSGGARRHGQQPRSGGGRDRPRAVSAERQRPGRRHFRLGCRLRRVHHRSAGAPRGSRRRGYRTARMKDTATSPAPPVPGGKLARLEAWMPILVLLVAGCALPLLGDSYMGVIGTRACIYWVLVAGLNLVVGFAGQIAIGWVALLTLGAYVTAVFTAGTVVPEQSPYVALLLAAALCAVFGLIVGLPALRLRTFYFAMTTLGFATIVTQIALAWKSVTGGGIGVPGPVFPWPFDSPWGFYFFCLGLAIVFTWMTTNVAASRFGRSLVASRDAEVAAESVGISKPALLVTIFLFSGALAGIAGGLFASLQSYITPDAFTFDLSVLFFIAILIGGRGSILGPLLGTIILTALPEFA